MFTIRPAEPRDYDGIALIRNRMGPEQSTGADLMREDEGTRRGQGAWVQRFVATADHGEMAGYVLAARFPWQRPDQAWIHVTVREGFRQQGAGHRLYEKAEGWARAQGAASVHSACGDTPEVFLDWAANRGFTAVRHRAEWRLALDQWDDSRFEPILEQARAQGFQLAMLPEVKCEAVMRSLYELMMQAQQDEPGFDEVQPDYETWRKAYDDRPGLALALHEGKVVALSDLLLQRVKSEGCYFRLTGVRREYRGRGLSLAVKVLALRAARLRAYPFAWTHNDVVNTPILRANASLGLRRVPGYYELVKQF
ncbi:MAG: N-acetyltransferase family protein [Mycobacterium leprae]